MSSVENDQQIEPVTSSQKALIVETSNNDSNIVEKNDARTTDTNNALDDDNSESAYLLRKPRDRMKLVCWGFLILGMTSLLPWNFFITATDYWTYKYRNTTSKPGIKFITTNNINEPLQRTPMQVFFESYLAIAANFPMLISMILNSLYGQRFGVNLRLYSTLATMLAVFILTTVLVPIDTDNMQWIFFGVTILLVVIIQSTSAIFQASIFGLVATFPEHHMHWLVVGQSLAGLLAVTIQILSMLSNTTPIESGLYYFSSSTVFIGFALLCFWLMNNNRYARHYLSLAPRQAGARDSSTPVSPRDSQEAVNLLQSSAQIKQILLANWHLSASIIAVFWATLAVFPGVCVLVLPVSASNPLAGRFFTPITTFLVYNIFDLLGRLASSYLPFPKLNKRLLLNFTLSRAILPVLIVFCNVYPKARAPVLFENDFAFPTLNALTAMTNGYIFSSAMVMAATGSKKEHLELTGFIMTSSLGVGLTLGSISSNILLRII